MQLEIAPLWTPTSYGKEHVTAYQVVAVDVIKTIDLIGTYRTEREAIAARDRITRAMLRMAGDPS